MLSSSAMNVMLAVQEKKTVPTDLYRPLRNYISRNYSELDAQSAEPDLNHVRSLRRELESPSDPSPEPRRDLLVSYSKSLSIIELRFPNLSSLLSFTWHDAFRPKLKATLPSIHLEMAAVLFNLGAVYSKMALSADGTSGQGLEKASDGFRSAAGIFGYLKDKVAGKLAAEDGVTVDVTAECAAMLERLMLAQAQECLLEKVIRDGRSRRLRTKVARQVGLYYEEAYAALKSPPLDKYFDQLWVSHVRLKSAQFFAEACYSYSLELDDKHEIGEEIARLNIGVNVLADAKNSAKGVAAPLMGAVTKLESNMNVNLVRAKMMNDWFYDMKVPPASSLSILPALSLVQPVPMAEVLDASKERLFTDINPDASVLSSYTKMFDDFFRRQTEEMQQRTEIVGVKLKEMDLPDSIGALEGNFSLPMDLKEDVEAVQISGGLSGLEAELQQLKDLRGVYQELLFQTEELLQKEVCGDVQLRTKFGTRWTRPDSTSLTKNIQYRLNRFAANLKQATDNDARIERAVTDNSVLMAILDCRPIESAFPSLERPIMSLDSNRKDAIVGAFKQTLRQLENLRAHRADLEDMLEKMKRKDDILPKLMANTGPYDDLFRKQITKYKCIFVEIAKDIEAQELLLLRIQPQKDEFAAAFNVEDYKVSREKSYKRIAAAVAKYREIKENINKELKFYTTLGDEMTKTRQGCGDLVRTRIQMAAVKMAAVNFSPGRQKRQ